MLLGNQMLLGKQIKLTGAHGALQPKIVDVEGPLKQPKTVEMDGPLKQPKIVKMDGPPLPQQAHRGSRTLDLRNDHVLQNPLQVVMGLANRKKIS